MINAGDIITDFPIEISTDQNIDKIETCTVCAIDSTLSTNKNCETVKVEVQKQQNCQVGLQIIEGKCVKEYKSDCSLQTTLCCPLSVELINGQYQCEGNTEICGNGIDDDSDGKIDCADSECAELTICKIKCSPWLELGGVTIIPNLWCVIDEAVKSVILPIAIVLGVLVGLIAYLLLRRISKELRLKQDVINTIILIVISLSLTALFIYIAYQLWWAVLIALIILFVIKVILR
jgi:hypothetical protein